jgi:hypothetical protein
MLNSTQRNEALDAILYDFDLKVQKFANLEDEVRYVGRNFRGTYLGGLLQGAALRIEGLQKELIEARGINAKD